MTNSDALTAAQNIIEPWNRAAINRDWDALLSMCTEDMVFMPPGAPPVSGEAIRPWLDAFPVIRDMNWSIDYIKESGDLAYLRGPVSETLEIEGQIVEFVGKYCDVMVRGADGQWRLSLVMWSANAE